MRKILCVLCASAASYAIVFAAGQDAPPAQKTSKPEFDVASIKRSSNAIDAPRNSVVYGPQSVTFGGVSLAFIIGEAYNFPVGRIVGPGSQTKQALWPALQTGYDIAAKAGQPVTRDAVRLMLQSVLSDRFTLALHREARTLPVYRLMVRNGGPTFSESDEAGPLAIRRTSEGFVFQNADMIPLTSFLSGQLDRQVVDETGLKGVYTFTLATPGEDRQSEASAKREGVSPDSPSGAAFDDGLRRLGLQLVSGRGPVDYLVVDGVETPSQN